MNTGIWISCTFNLSWILFSFWFFWLFKNVKNILSSWAKQKQVVGKERLNGDGNTKQNTKACGLPYFQGKLFFFLVFNLHYIVKEFFCHFMWSYFLLLNKRENMRTLVIVIWKCVHKYTKKGVVGLLSGRGILGLSSLGLLFLEKPWISKMSAKICHLHFWSVCKN